MKYTRATIAFILCVGLTAGATYFAFRSSRLENAGRFERATVNIANAFRNRMTVYLNALLYTRNLFEIKANLNQQDFSEFVGRMNLPGTFPGIQSMGYIERLNRGQAIRKLKEMNIPVEHGGVLPASRDIDLVTFFERFFPNTAAVRGMDLGSSEERRKAMDAARDSGEAVATDRVLPIGLPGTTNYAFLVFLPRYKDGADLSTIEARRKALIGFLYAGFRSQVLFSRVSDDVRMRSANLAIRIYDGSGNDPRRMMFSEGDFKGANVDSARMIEFKAANHTWTVEIAPFEDFGLAYLRWSPYIVLTLGILLSLAVAVWLYNSERLSRRLKKAREEADSANRAKSMFLANISHEIRTPLGVIIGFAESALTEPNVEVRDSYLNTILKNGNELTRIIGDVLDLSKIEAKTLMIEHRPFSLKKMNADLKNVWSSLAQTKGLSFHYDDAQDIPEFIKSDETRVRQILNNLLSNAVKFTHEGFVRITVEVDSAFNLVYAVEDTGIGIREENRSKLFRAFTQEDSSITRKFGGSGLGLAISKELAQALDGELTIEANPAGKGSRFVFRIPLVLAGGPTATNITDVPDESIFRGRRILLAEDSLDNQFLIGLIFKKSGVHMTVANNGREALNELEKGQFDLILMDIQMPVMDGYAAFEEIKAKGIQIPVIALTAHALKEEMEKALAIGFSAYLTKPIDRARLLQVTAQLLSRSKRKDVPSKDSTKSFNSLT